MIASPRRSIARPCALALVLAAVVASSAGCATAWLVTQATNTPRVWDESVREQVVPQPGIDERLTVTLPLVTEYEPVATPTQPGATMAPPAAPVARPFALTCSADQQARDTVYHSAFRYGSRWKKGMLLMFLAEGAAGAALLLLAADKPENVLIGGFFAIDAIGTGALVFAPRKEIYRHDERPVLTHLRSDCPDGLALVLGGEPFPIDAAGKLGEVGDAALADWMAQPAGPLELEIAGQRRALPIGAAELCAWQRDHQRGAAGPSAACSQAFGVTPRVTAATIVVPAGTLTQVAEH